jgi:hypothetical protein
MDIGLSNFEVQSVSSFVRSSILLLSKSDKVQSNKIQYILSPKSMDFTNPIPIYLQYYFHVKWLTTFPLDHVQQGALAVGARINFLAHQQIGLIFPRPYSVDARKGSSCLAFFLYEVYRVGQQEKQLSSVAPGTCVCRRELRRLGDDLSLCYYYFHFMRPY